MGTVTPRFLSVAAIGLAIGCAASRAAEPESKVLTPAQQDQFQRLSDLPLHRLDQAEFAEYLQLRRVIEPADLERDEPGVEIAHFARKAIGQPFRLGAGMFDLRSADCVTHVERSIAAGCATTWEEYIQITQRLRHKDGEVTFLQRNFFPLAQWVPNNAWLLRDVTAELNVEAVPFTYAAYPKRFYANLEFGEDDTPLGTAKSDAKAALVASLPEKELHEDVMIPIEEVSQLGAEIQPGDIVLFIRQRSAPGLAPWLYCDHMAVVAADAGEPVFVHATVDRGVRKHPLVTFKDEYYWIKGVKILRMNAPANVNKDSYDTIDTSDLQVLHNRSTVD